MGFGVPVAGAAGLHVVDGVALLRPDEQVFTAMLAGWRDQQLACNLSLLTVTKRESVVRVHHAREHLPLAVERAADR